MYLFYKKYGYVGVFYKVQKYAVGLIFLCIYQFNKSTYIHMYVWIVGIFFTKITTVAVAVAVT